MDAVTSDWRIGWDGVGWVSVDVYNRAEDELKAGSDNGCHR